ncbi:UNVERIFIED_CONTAM: hypothetical protein HDU68_012409 [Siphonaria sp. JEL0065]|nr:hypothetical protein HDU68_012409 [Siphonaria sp. JEL0065]
MLALCRALPITGTPRAQQTPPSLPFTLAMNKTACSLSKMRDLISTLSSADQHQNLIPIQSSKKDIKSVQGLSSSDTSQIPNRVNHPQFFDQLDKLKHWVDFAESNFKASLIELNEATGFIVEYCIRADSFVQVLCEAGQIDTTFAKCAISELKMIIQTSVIVSDRILGALSCISRMTSDIQTVVMEICSTLESVVKYIDADNDSIMKKNEDNRKAGIIGLSAITIGAVAMDSVAVLGIPVVSTAVMLYTSAANDASIFAEKRMKQVIDQSEECTKHFNFAGNLEIVL